MATKVKKHDTIVSFAAYAHGIGPVALLKEMLENGTPTNVAYYALDQLWGDQPEFCPHCNQEIIDEE